MAVPFYVPEESEGDVGRTGTQQSGRTRRSQDSGNGSSPSTTASTPSSSTAASSQQQTPNDPNNNHANSHEQLLQMLCEAIYRVGGSPNYQMTPLSPSCSPQYYSGDNYFFPRSVPTPRTPRTPNDRRQPQFDYSRRRPRLSSTGEDDYEDHCATSDHETSLYSSASSSSSSSSSNHEENDEHLSYMAARERLQMFPGRVPPPRKKKKKEQKFAWPTVVTAVVLAVGCGILVTRN